jgi:uncharacterized protein YutE (UPF0331/DUF86 family)
MDKTFIEKKLEMLDGYLNEINPVLQNDIETILADKNSIRILERLFQLIVDSAIDVNRFFIEKSNIQIPDTYQGTFYTMTEINILEKDFSTNIAPSVGLRNRIVHRYDDIKIKVMIEGMKKFVPLYHKYIKIIFGNITNN